MFFFFNDTATTEIYTLSLHDALPILRPPTSSSRRRLLRRSSPRIPSTSTSTTRRARGRRCSGAGSQPACRFGAASASRSEEHTSELQSRQYLVCRLLLEKKKTIPIQT